MGVLDLIVVHDSDDDGPPSLGTMGQHAAGAGAFWRESERRKKMGQNSTKKKIAHHAAAGSRKRQHGVSVGGSRKAESSKRQHALADSSSTADSEDSEDVVAAGSRKRQHGVSAGGSRRAGSSKRQHYLADSSSTADSEDSEDVAAARSGNRQHAVSAGRSMKKELHKLAKSYVATGHTLVTTVEMKMIHKFLASVFPVYGCEDGTCSVIVHTLTATNVNKKQMKVPRRAVPNDLALSGPVTLRYHPTLSVKGSYSVLTRDDGRVKIDCWKNFIKLVGWKVNMKIVMLFCRPDDVTWLFVDPLDAVVMA